MKEIDILINWFLEIQGDQHPEIPYNLHPLVKALHDTLGTHESISLLQQLKEYAITRQSKS